MKKFIVLKDKILNVEEIVAVVSYEHREFKSEVIMKTYKVLLEENVNQVLYALKEHERENERERENLEF